MKLIWIALAVVSAATTLLGIVALTAFDAAPGQALAAPPVWPESSALERHPDRAELLIFVHPFCSCTNATVAELAKLRTAAPAITFVVFRPHKDSNWQARIAAVPGSRLVWDDAGIEARRFGAATSGDVLLYSARGTLLFHGGITGARGHEGDNYGLSALLAALKTAKTAHSVPRSSQVFGCSIRGPHGPLTP
jgi:hypothetical protein